jgi:hypothetical protein
MLQCILGPARVLSRDSSNSNGAQSTLGASVFGLFFCTASAGSGRSDVIPEDCGGRRAGVMSLPRLGSVSQEARGRGTRIERRPWAPCIPPTAGPGSR